MIGNSGSSIASRVSVSCAIRSPPRARSARLLHRLHDSHWRGRASWMAGRTGMACARRGDRRSSAAVRLVLTLVCRDFETLQPALAEGLEAVAGAGQPVLEMRQLGEGAIDLFTEGENPEALARAAARALERQPADFCAQPAEGRRKRLLVSDMDSTIIGCEFLDELADFPGLKAEIAAITARAMAGEIPFEGALIERVSRLAGLGL